MNRNRTTRPGLLSQCAGAACACALFGAASTSSALAQDRDPFGAASSENAEIIVSEYLTVDMHVQDEDLSNVLQMLSIQSERNIVISSDVSAMVTADLYNVTFFEALEAILNVNGYGYVERGNFIYVYTLEEIARIDLQNRVPVSKVIHLDYLNGNDASEFVSPLLSEIGQIKTNGDVDTFNLPDDNPVGDEQFALSATIVIFDYPEHVEEIEKLIKQLDTKPSQVLVEATILQTALNEANAFGIDFAFLNNINFTDFMNVGGPLSAAGALITGGSGGALGATGGTSGSTGGTTGASGGGGAKKGLSPANNHAIAGTSTVGNTSGPGGFKVGIIQDDISVFLRLLDEITDTTVIANPKVLAVNRTPARVLVGQRIGFLNTTSTQTSTTQTVDFLDTGTQLSFRPFISKNGDIRMELNPSVSEGVIRQASNASGVTITIPDEITQEITTNVIVRDGSTIVLGGLFKETTQVGRRQVPFVGDIPIIGLAFRGHDDTTSRSEIIFMITPTIMNDEVLLSQGEEAMDEMRRVRAGSRTGLLPWSRGRMTARLNLDAEKLAAAGETQEALWKLRRSLNLDSNQPEAIKLREKLLSESTLWPSRSILERVYDDELGYLLDYEEEASTQDAMLDETSEESESIVSSEPANDVETIESDTTSAIVEESTVDTEADTEAVVTTPEELAPAADLVPLNPAVQDQAEADADPINSEFVDLFFEDMMAALDAEAAAVDQATLNDSPAPVQEAPATPMLPSTMSFIPLSDLSDALKVNQPSSESDIALIDTRPILFPNSPLEMMFLIGDSPIPPRYTGFTISSGWRSLRDIFSGSDQQIELPTLVGVDTDADAQNE